VSVMTISRVQPHALRTLASYSTRRVGPLVHDTLLTRINRFEQENHKERRLRQTEGFE
jgi:hypothetical protein